MDHMDTLQPVDPHRIPIWILKPEVVTCTKVLTIANQLINNNIINKTIGVKQTVNHKESSNQNLSLLFSYENCSNRLLWMVMNQLSNQN